MVLADEIKNARGRIHSDSYGISIGEWISLYEKNELDIHPEFQRFFRWTASQKSRLIESILLGIPIPPIFVSQREDGVWDVVDGLQRLATIFQLVGSLRGEDGQPIEPLTLEATKYLPSLGGKRWEVEDANSSLTAPERLIIKRAKLDVSIILKESSETTKYELFQRLNTGGSPLSEQEVRSCILIMVNREMHRFTGQLATDQNFIDCTSLTDRALHEQYDLELVARFLVFRRLPSEALSFNDLGDFLTDKMVELAGQRDYPYEVEGRAFRTTFEVIKRQVGEDCFRRYDPASQRFIGPFSVSAFEAVALGIGYNFESIARSSSAVLEKVRTIWSSSTFTENSGSGVRASTRIPRTVPFARNLFAP